MADSFFRIPQAAAATVLLLGSACADDNKSSNSTSASRISSVIKDYCKQYAVCEPQDFADYYSSQEDCRSSFEDDFAEEAEDAPPGCVDAVLDFYACMASQSCDNAEVACAKASAVAEKKCDFEDSSASGGGNQSVSAHRRKGLRIPR